MEGLHCVQKDGKLESLTQGGERLRDVVRARQRRDVLLYGGDFSLLVLIILEYQFNSKTSILNKSKIDSRSEISLREC